jgi:predicted ATPase
MTYADLEAGLRQALPPAQQSASTGLVRLLAAAIEGTLPSEQARERLAADPNLAGAIHALTGQTVTTSSAVITFGEGAQTGDITISGDLAGGNIVKLTLNLSQQTINTGGGDYAEGSIDRRQGAFIEKGATVYGDVIGQVVYSAPPIPALHQLRAPIGEFVGREQEVEQLVQALSQPAAGSATAAIGQIRGMGGIGKTELASIVAQRLMAHFPDAQLLVELRGASNDPLSPEQALQALVRAFEREANLPDDLSRLQTIYRSLLANKRVLILADDARDAAQVRPLLPPPGSALLVISRNRFLLPGIRAEAVVDLRMLAPAEAEALLLSICPRIGDQAADLAHLCGLLPLALRVCASLLAADDTRSIARYLRQLEQERLTFLHDPDDTRTSVEASLRLSYDALDPAVQAAFCQVSVFPTSFDLAAAQTVVVATGEVEEVLGLLRRRSLLDWDGALERYSQHDLLRAFAEARLEDADSIRLRHAQHYLRLAEQAEPETLGAEQELWLERLEQEHDHLRAALGWAIGQRDTEIALRISAAMWRFWWVRGHLSEGLRLISQALTLPDKEPRSRGVEMTARAWALRGAGILAHMQGDYAQARALYDESLTLHRALANKAGIAAALSGLGHVALRLGYYRTARTSFEQSLAYQRELGSQRGIAGALGDLGTVARLQGEHARAERLCTERLALVRALGLKRDVALALASLGHIAIEVGNYQDAQTVYDESLALFQSLNARGNIAILLANLGIIAQGQDNPFLAQQHYAASLRLFRELGDRRGAAIVLGYHGSMLLKQGDIPGALAQHTESLVLYRDLNERLGVADRLESIAAVRAAQNKFEDAARLWGAAEALRADLGTPIWPVNQPDYERAVAAARAALGESAFESAMNAGRVVSMAQAIAEALDERPTR